ncbi:MAG TPA: SigE family RNA polymerase sigma factor [Mycobacteriales bacterium]|jgi:RNA polymerase sigma-70 factor (sigma-E family)|nr:SigE family RNA polymerase sigma factor [Mycobacteriales bacterium]
MGRENDEDFREFVATRSPALLRTAYLLTGDRGLAEDLVQSALTRAYRHWARVRTAGSPEAYVRTILLNEQRRWWRKPSSREVLAGELPERPGRDEPAAVDERDRLWRPLQQMPPRTKAILILRYWEDFSEIATAEILGCSVGSVKSQASRGLRRLQALLDPANATEGGAR